MTVAQEPSLDDAVKSFFASERDAIQNPFELLARLRREAPVHPFGEDIVLVSRYDHIRAVMTDHRRFSNEFMSDKVGRAQRLEDTLDAPRKQSFREFVALERSLTFHADGKEHERRRRSLHHLFTPNRVSQLQAAAQEIVDEIVEDVAGADTVDLAPYAYTLSGAMIAFLLGVPRSDCKRMASWTDPIANNLHSARALDPAYAAVQQMQGYVDEMVAQPTDSRTELFGTIVSAAEGFAPERLMGIFLEMNLGGVESVRGLLSGGLAALLSNPEQLHKLRDDPSLMPNAIEELLRFVTPGLWTSRAPLEDVEIGGVRIDRNKVVMTLVGAANRDPEVFENPDTLDITRPNARNHFAFGHGRHYCLGQALARLEASVFLGTLIERFPDMELIDTNLTWSGHAQNPRVDRLEVRLGTYVEPKRGLVTA